jgi:hypothetical protein
MTSVPHINPLAAPVDHSVPGLRLRLKPKAAATCLVDGGWWPRTRGLSIELEALVHVLDVRLGNVTRVAFALDDWETAPRRTTVDGRVVRPGGFHSRSDHALHVSGADHQRLVHDDIKADTVQGHTS